MPFYSGQQLLSQMKFSQDLWSVLSLAEIISFQYHRLLPQRQTLPANTGYVHNQPALLFSLLAPKLAIFSAI